MLSSKMNNGKTLTLVSAAADCAEATYLCDCGEVFDVSAHTEENLELGPDRRLYAVCPQRDHH